jgi:hypothetical protein
MEGIKLAYKRIDIILEEVDQEYSIPSYLEDDVKRGIAKALMKIDKDQELLSDLMMEQKETM